MGCLRSTNGHAQDRAISLNYQRATDSGPIDVVWQEFNRSGGKGHSVANERLDDPNTKQMMMSRTFIDNANFAFNKNDLKDEDLPVLAGLRQFKVPKIESNFHKVTFRRGKRTMSWNPTNLEDGDVTTDERKNGRDSEMAEKKVHCVKSGTSEAICTHDNFTYTFKLPQELFSRKLMEKLVSSVCTIVEEAMPEGEGKVGLTVENTVKNLKESGGNEKSMIENTAEGCDDDEDTSNKVIRINIPIDFSAIPLSDDRIKPVSRKLVTSGRDEPDSGRADKSESPAKLNHLSARDKETIFLTSDDNSILQTDEDGSSCPVDDDDNREKWLRKRHSIRKHYFRPRLVLIKRSAGQVENSSDLLTETSEELRDKLSNGTSGQDPNSCTL